MKTLYLLLGLMILCAAGTGAINTSLGYIDEQNLNQSTPFLIFGHVLYADRSPCNSSIVNITNQNTSAKWCADAVSGCSYYQALLCAANVSAGDVLQWNATNGAVFNITNRTVYLSDLKSGGIFDFDIILQLAPKIIGCAPESLIIHDVGNAERSFKITIDQVVDVTWLINGTEVQTDMGVTNASYTNTSAVLGCWNVSAVANNTNGTVMRTWNWAVTAVLPPEITSYNPDTPVSDIKGVTRIFNITVDQVVDVTWLINGTEVLNEAYVNESSYTNTSADTGIRNVSAIASNGNGSVTQKWVWHVDPVSSDSNATQPVIIYGWVLYENSSVCIGPLVNISNLNTSMEWQAETHNVTHYYQLMLDSANVSTGDVLLINASKNGTSVGNVTHTVNQTEIEQGAIEMNINTWMPDLLIPESGVSIPPLLENETNTINVTVYNNGTCASGAFNISFSVQANASCENASCEYMNETRISDGLQQSSSINLSFSWQPASIGSHNITFFTDSNHEINESNELNNNLTMTTFVGVPDFTVTNLALTHEPLVIIEDIIRINATIANTGTEGEALVRLYDNKSIMIERMLNEHPESPINDTITLPDVKRIRVHFESFDVSSVGNITIYNETRMVGWFNGTGTDNWTEWCDGGTIRINSCNAGFTVDRYEAVFADRRISLGTGNSTDISGVWNLSDQSVGWAVHGSHNITIRADPENEVVEYNETNNEKIEVIDVHPSLDFTVTNMSLNTTESVLGDVVGITANISNYGVRNGTTSVGLFYDNRSIEIVEDLKNIRTNKNEIRTITVNIPLPPSVSGARLHFNSLYVYNGYVDICDENGQVVERFCVDEKRTINLINIWTDFIYTDNIRVNIVFPYNPNMGTHEYKFKIDRYEALIAEEHVTLNSTESKIINASWLTGAAYGGAREHNIIVMVDPRDQSIETNETNNTRRSEEIFVNGTDLSVTALKILYNPSYVGQNVDVLATIANIGAADATNFTIEFLDGSSRNCNDINTSGVNFNTTHIDRLNSGETRNISVIWNPSETGYRTITANIPYDNSDNNETNNEMPRISLVKEGYDFLVESVSVEPSKEVRRGESVNITATVCNSNISQTGEKVSVAFFVNSTDFAGTSGERFNKIGTKNVVLGVGETKNVSMNWNVDVAGGCHLIAAVVNPDNDIDEGSNGTIYIPNTFTIIFRGSDTGNNVKNCTLYVKPHDVDITDITLDPAEPIIGDLVNVSATIINNNKSTANSTVWFYMEKNVSTSITLGSGSHASKSESILQPGDVQIRVHFDYIKIRDGKSITGSSGEVNAVVIDDQSYDHQVEFYVKCKDYGGQDAKAPKIEYEYKHETNITTGTACYYIDGFDRRWDDVWTDWTNGTTIKIRAVASSCPINLLIDKYQVRLGNETITLDPNDSMVYHSTWDASLPLEPGENYTLLANVEDDVERKEIHLGGTDLAITNLSVKSPVWDGDMVWVNATIENLGSRNATAFSVSFTETSSYPFNTTDIEGLDAGNSKNISVLWNANIRGIVDELADNYTTRVIAEINPRANKDNEIDDTNHVEEADVHVKRSRDFNVTNLSFSVNGTACDPMELNIYDDVVLNATVNITNFLAWSSSVDVNFYIDEDEIESCSTAFGAGNGTEHAEINWTIVSLPGEYNITVVADPDKEIYEINETNNNLTAGIRLNAPELVLENLDIHPNNPREGETMKINVTIANKGVRNASNVNLTVYDWGERHIEDVSNQSGPGCKTIKITKENATAMRLYLDLSVEVGCKVCVNDNNGGEIICYDVNFHGWTPWILDNSTTIIVTNNETDSTCAKVSKVYYLVPDSIINTSIHSIGTNETKNITVNWNTSVGGERFIAAIVDPEDCVIEYNESNNRLAEFISVQTADIEVSNLSLLWLNGTKIGNDTIIHSDCVNITVNIANIGVDDADNFSVRFLIDDIPIKEEPIKGLAEGAAIPLFTDWNATVGYNLIKVEADYRNEINETNETNNIMAWEKYVCGAELSGNISWVTLGLDGELLFPDDPTQPYDEDEINITVDIRNSGFAPAENFNATLFFDYMPSHFQKRGGCSWPGGKWINKTYPDAEYIYIKVDTPVYIPGVCRCMVKDDVIVYDGNDSEVARPEKSCWVRVNGNTTNVLITPEGYSLYRVFDIYFYPIYQNETSMLYKDINVSVNSSYNLFSMNQNVSVGNFTIKVVIDPDNEVSEDENHREDNVVYKTMRVKPTRDFTVTNVIAARTNRSDLDIAEITAGVSNIGLRNGTAEVNVIDYEKESRTYKYHFNRSFDLSYLPIAPNAMLSGIQFDASRTSREKLRYYEELTIIHRPGVDGIKLHFDEIKLHPPVSGGSRGRIEVCNETGARKYYREYRSNPREKPTILLDPDVTLVPGETVYICTYNADFKLGGYITERKLHREDITLNATTIWNESKNITAMWTEYTGDQTITVTLDGDDKINEISESNNELSSLFHVNASRDPAIIDLNTTPEHPKDGDDVEISAIITNNGYKDANFTIDVWANLTRTKPEPDESLPVPNLSTDLGEDRIRHITLLNHENVTLAPGENWTVNVTWNDISIAGSPTHHIIVIVDPTDEIDEINESNNEIVKEIIMDYPDLTLGTVRVPRGAVKPVVPVKELRGTCEAPKVTVRFEMYKTEKCNKGCGRISKENASYMQVYFNHINIIAENGFVEVRDKDTEFPKPPVEIYNKGVYTDMWSPWVKGNWINIECSGGGTNVKIREYRWGNVLDNQTGELDAGGHEDVELPWTEYREPYDLTITVDPDNNITELNEDNNEKTIRMGADIAVRKYVNVDPYAPIMGDTCYIQNIKNIGNLHTGEFNVTISINATNEVAFEHNTTINETISLAPNEEYLFPWKTPEVEPPDDIDYDIRIIADTEDVVKELREDNNEGSGDVTVYSHSNYTGGKLYLYDTDWVYGGINYTIGDSTYNNNNNTNTNTKSPWDDYIANYEDVIPENIMEDDIKLARLYLYWTWGKAYSINENKFVPVPIEVDVKFNDEWISEDRRYLDYPHATSFDVSWGTYTYEIPPNAVKSDNSVIVDRYPFKKKYESDQFYSSPQPFGIYGVGLLVIYEDENGVLTNYWINEGGDVIYEGANALGIEDMVTTAAFMGKVEEEDMANATLWTVTPGGNDENMLYFNDMGWGNVWSGEIGIDHRCVTEHLIAKDNTARLQYITGNSMMSSGAFLFVRYPPDLAVTDIEAPVSAVVGNEYTINTTISNEGISNATYFNVSFYSNNMRIGGQKISRLDSGDNITLQFNWRPMHVGKIYKIKVAADVVSGQDWIETDTDNNEMTEKVPIVASGFGNESGSMGGGGAGAGGSGDGEGASLFDTITGILMKGTILKDGGGGGGGLGEFSLLEWLMKGLILATCSLLIIFGYSIEKRRHNKR